MNYNETLDFLFNSLPDFQNTGAEAYKPGLGSTEKLLHALGDPQHKFRTIHVAGTNGKGSCSHILASVLQSAGYQTGLYTSPHLIDFRERIKIDGQMISPEQVVDFVEKHKKLLKGLSFFEMTVGMCFDHFARSGVEIAVIETGLGGRLDSTNVITPLLSIITNIGFDHMALLGDTLPKIAAEKAGIIKPGVPVVIGEYDHLTAPVFIRRAEELGSPITFAEHLYRCLDSTPEQASQRFSMEDYRTSRKFNISLDLQGHYQRKNIVTVMAAIDKLPQLELSALDVERGTAHAALDTGLHGRWEILSHNPLTVCDTGHNGHGLRYVTEQIKAQQFDKLYIVFGAVSDKDLGAVLPLMPTGAHYIFTQASVDRARPAEQVQMAAAEYGLRGEVVTGVAQACRRAQQLASPSDMIFIGGSTFVVSECIHEFTNTQK